MIISTRSSFFDSIFILHFTLSPSSPIINMSDNSEQSTRAERIAHLKNELASRVALAIAARVAAEIQEEADLMAQLAIADSSPPPSSALVVAVVPSAAEIVVIEEEERLASAMVLRSQSVPTIAAAVQTTIEPISFTIESIFNGALIETEDLISHPIINTSIGNIDYDKLTPSKAIAIDNASDAAKSK